MKLFAAILGVLTLYLTAQEPVLTARIPAPVNEDCDLDKSCSSLSGACKKETPSQPAEEKPVNCCELYFCNPFGACCTYIPAERPLLTAASFFIQTRTATAADENCLSNYIPSIWQPPETGSLV